MTRSNDISHRPAELPAGAYWKDLGPYKSPTRYLNRRSHPETTLRVSETHVVATSSDTRLALRKVSAEGALLGGVRIAGCERTDSLKFLGPHVLIAETRLADCGDRFAPRPDDFS